LYENIFNSNGSLIDDEREDSLTRGVSHSGLIFRSPKKDIPMTGDRRPFDDGFFDILIEQTSKRTKRQ
jgi:hypothetical protein